MKIARRLCKPRMKTACTFKFIQIRLFSHSNSKSQTVYKRMSNTCFVLNLTHYLVQTLKLITATIFDNRLSLYLSKYSLVRFASTRICDSQ